MPPDSTHLTSADRAERTRERPPFKYGRVELLEETIVPSPNVVELRRTPTSDYVFRFAETTPHVAELYHENSRITPHGEANAVMDPDALIGVRKWFYGTAYLPRDDVFDEEKAREIGLLADARDLVPRAGAPIARLLEPDVPELAFGLDLLLLVEERIYRLVPGRDALWLERRYPERDLEAIGDCLPELDEEDGRPGALLFVVGAAWRYMALQGPRGYRRTLLEAGRLLQVLETAAGNDGGDLRVSLDFYDARLDRLLRLDGVERAVLAAVAMTAPPPQPEPEEEP
jgi:hypothetical protein